MNENESQTLEDLINDEYDRLGLDDDSDDSYVVTDEGSQNDSDDKSSQGEQPKDEKNEETQGDDSGDKSERLFAGQFKTVEELEQAYQSKSVKQDPVNVPEQKEDENKLADLNRQEFVSLCEVDDMDGTSYTSEYLKTKMQERDLTPFELEKLKELDSDKNEDLYGQYVSLKTKREVRAEIAPVLAPIEKENREKAINEFMDRERKIVDSCKDEFENYTELKDKVSKPDFVKEIIQGSDLGPVILREFESGSKATAHKLLIQEADKHLRKQTDNINREKKRKSFPADVGGSSAASKHTVDKADTVEDAFDAAWKELKS